MTDIKALADEMLPGYQALRRAARTFDDLQHERILIGNRLRHGTTPTEEAVLSALADTEKAARRLIEVVYAEVVSPGIIAWQERTPGISDYQLGRLLGEAGHPCIAMPWRQIDNPDFDPDQPQGHDNDKRIALPGEPFLRTVSQWRQRCGNGRPGRVPKDASQADVLGFGLPRAKMVVHLMMESCWKLDGKPDKNGRARARSPYRTVAEDAKALYADRAHTGPCPGGYVSAGPGKVLFAKCKVMEGKKLLRYAEEGDPISPSHVHAIGLRHAGKRMLEDLYEAGCERMTTFSGDSRNLQGERC